MALAPTFGSDTIPTEPTEAGLPPASTVTEPWPDQRVAWYALFVFALALMFSMLDKSIFAMMIEMVKRSLNLSDLQIGFLLGPASIFFFVFVGIPLARLVDIYPRNVVLSAGIVVWSGITVVCGMVQGFGQLVVCRMIGGVGGSAHGPGTYSMMADFFPPKKLPRAIAFMQLGYIFGVAGSSIFGGLLLDRVAHWQPSHIAGLTIYNWQWVLIAVGLPGLVVAAMMRALPEPPRRGKITKEVMPIGQVFKEIWHRRNVYRPMMIGLGFSQVETQGLMDWRVPFMQRTYGWTPGQVGTWAGIVMLISFPLALIVGTTLT